LVGAAIEKCLGIDANAPFGNRVQRSAPVQKILEDLGLEVGIHLADAYFHFPGPKPLEIFLKGVDIGRLAKQKIVTYAVLDGKDWLFFLGPEAEVLRMLSAQVQED
jgi:RNA polymerase-binding protein DksA